MPKETSRKFLQYDLNIGNMWECVAQWINELTRNPKVAGSNPRCDQHVVFLSKTL